MVGLLVLITVMVAVAVTVTVAIATVLEPQQAVAVLKGSPDRYDGL